MYKRVNFKPQSYPKKKKIEFEKELDVAPMTS